MHQAPRSRGLFRHIKVCLPIGSPHGEKTVFAPRPHDYSKWDRLAQALDDDEAADRRESFCPVAAPCSQDPMTWPVCQEIPWNTVGRFSQLLFAVLVL